MSYIWCSATNKFGDGQQERRNRANASLRWNMGVDIVGKTMKSIMHHKSSLKANTWKSYREKPLV